MSRTPRRLEALPAGAATPAQGIDVPVLGRIPGASADNQSTGESRPDCGARRRGRGGFPLWRLAVFLVGILTLQAQEILVPNGANWRYRKGTNEVSAPTSAWRDRTFNDAAWPTGPAPFHYGESLTTGTTLTDMRGGYTGVFLRRSFVVTNPAEVVSLSLDVAFDDGFVAWINAVEVARQNVTGDPLYTSTATANHEALPSETFTPAAEPRTYLVAGTNVLAVQAFNRSLADSGDFRLELALTFTRPPPAPPRIAARAPVADTVLDDLTAVTVTFDQPVLGVDAVDLRVNDVPAVAVTALADGVSHTFQCASPPPGPAQVTWDDTHGITGTTGAPFDPATSGGTWGYTIADHSPPVVREVMPVAGAQAGRLTEARVLFSEPVAGVDLGDLRVNGQGATNLTGQGAGPYVFAFPPPAAGPVRFEWAAGHGITDRAAVPNAFAGGTWSVTFTPGANAGDVGINEFLAASLSGLQDEDGSVEDWIELVNRGPTPVNLLGWSLTDDPAVPGKWTFPSRTLAPGEFLVVFASQKDRRSPGANRRYHTNFKLNPVQEYLALFNADSPPAAATEFAPRYPEQRNNHSYGLVAGGAWRHFATPTPGLPNGASTLAGLAPAPHFSVTRGLFDRPFTLLLTTPLTNATIRYTTDGSEPSATTGFVYAAPLTISRSTVLRAATFHPGHLPSRTRTHTYLFPAQVLQQPAAPAGYPPTWGTAANFPNNVVPADYEMDPEVVNDPRYAARMLPALTSLPVVALAGRIDDFFGPSGIYPNPLSRGPAWERPVSVEFFTPDGSESFQEDGGVQIQGNAAREPYKNPKHPLRLTFKGDYGPTEFEHALFPDSPVRSFDTLILRADFNYSWLHWNAVQRTRAQRLRDAWAKDTVRAMGALASHNRYAHLFINGLYWGLYDPAERPDGAFAAAYLGGEKEDYDVVNEGAAVDGDLGAYNQMLAVAGGNLAALAQYVRLQAWLDLPQFIDYMLFHFYIGHEDWGLNKNWYTVRRRDGTAGGFRYLPWDQEMILGAPGNNRVSNPDVPSGLHTKLLASAQYRLDFADAVQRHCFNDGALTPTVVSNLWLRRAAGIAAAMPAEAARWGDYRRDVHPYSAGPYEFYTPDTHWQAEQQRLLKEYFPQRTATLLQQLRDAGLYPATAAPACNRHGGRVPTGFPLTLTAPAGTIYYTTDGTDPRAYGTGDVAAGARIYAGTPVALTETTEVRARTRQGTDWSALTVATFTVGSLTLPLRFTEIMYNPPGGDAFEFLELAHVGSTALDLSGFSLSGVYFVFPDSTRLAPGAVLVLGSDANPAAFAARYPGVTVSGRFSGSLANGGERLALLDRAGRVVLAVHFDDEGGWPAQADGGGASLELIDPGGDPHAPATWQASAGTFGTPGRPPAPAPPPVVGFDEILTDNVAAVPNGDDFPDWVELGNRGDQPVDLAGWSLTDDGNPRRFVFPDGTTLPGGGRLVVWCDAATNAAGLHTGFALDREGENLALFDAQTRRVDAVSFGRIPADYSLGRVAGGWTLTRPTPGDPNVPAPLAPASSLALNEWLVNAAPGTDDWLELFNRSATTPVALQGLHVATATALTQFRALAFLAPGAHLRLLADERPGPDHLELKLPATGGPLVLSDATGLELDRVDATAQPEGISEGRLPDGTGAVTAFPGSASPGAANYRAAWDGPVLNEIVATPTTPGPWGRRAGWVELVNPTAGEADLTGFALGTSARPADRWSFPAGITIPAGAALVVWFDPGQAGSTQAAPPLNTGLALDPESLDVWFFNAAGQAVDGVAAGFQIPDLSIGRQGGSWALLATPSPGAPNAAPDVLGDVAALRFNEWMAAPAEGDDWFELYNPGDRPVALDGLYLTDHPSVGGRTNTRVAPLSFLAPRGWVVWRADGHPGNGRNHAGFSLDEAGETLQLYRADLTLIDGVDFGWQTTDVSEGRLPDGTATLVDFPGTATPGAYNRVAGGDTDADGLPDDWELANGTDPRVPDAGLDPDGDGLTNGQEYVAGTHPGQAASVLRLEAPELADGGVVLRFRALPGRSYGLQARDADPVAGWVTVHRTPAGDTEQMVTVTDDPSSGQRWFRLVTPAPP